MKSTFHSCSTMNPFILSYFLVASSSCSSSLSLSAPVHLHHLTIWNCTKYNLYNSERRTIIMLSKRIISTRLPIIIAQPCAANPILVMMQSSSGTVIILPSVNPWAPILSAIRISSAHSQRHILSRSRVGVEAAVGAVACNQRLPCRRCGNPAAEKLCIIKYCIYTYICYGSALLVSYFTYNFVWFWFCTIYTTLDWDPRATDTRGSTPGSLGPRLGSLSLTVFSGGLLWSFVSKATKWCGISNNNWENTKRNFCVGLQRVFGWQTWKKINRKIENKTQKWNNWKTRGPKNSSSKAITITKKLRCYEEHW